mgnify:CR=1 FL=1
MIKGNPEFIMIDEQRVVYEEVIQLSEQCQKDRKKRTIICEGGPGTGKSVIAIQLLSELTQRDQFVQYVSKNSGYTIYGTKVNGGKSVKNVEKREKFAIIMGNEEDES